MKDQSEIELIKRLARRLDRAIMLLKKDSKHRDLRGYNKIYRFITSKISLPGINSTLFYKYAKAGSPIKVRITKKQNESGHTKRKTITDYTKDGVQSFIYPDLFAVLDPEIKSRTHHVWRGDEQGNGDYVLDNSMPKVYDDRLYALVGTWIAYTWDKKFSNDEIHRFKLQIHSHLNIDCETKNTIFTLGEISIIGKDRLYLELGNQKNDRRVTLITDLGILTAQTIPTIPDLEFIYLDSSGRVSNGVKQPVKSGRIIIERTKMPYKDIPCGSVSLNTFDSKKRSRLSKIIGDQISLL